MIIGVTQDPYMYTYIVEKFGKFARTQKHLCRGCGKTKARFWFGGRIKARNDHDLCFRCYRSSRAMFLRVARLTPCPG